MIPCKISNRGYKLEVYKYLNRFEYNQSGMQVGISIYYVCYNRNLICMHAVPTHK